MRFDDLRLSLAIVVAATAPRDMSTNDCVELFKLSIEAVSSNKYPSQLAAQLEDSRARLDLLRFMNEGRCKSTESQVSSDGSTQSGSDATKALMRQLQLLSNKPSSLESQTILTINIYQSLQNILMSCHSDKLQPRIINMLIDTVGNVREETLRQLNLVSDKDTLQAFGFERAFASTVVRSLIKLMIHPESVPSIQIKIVNTILELLNTQDNHVAISIFRDIMRQLYEFVSDDKGKSECVASLLALLSISALNVDSTHANHTSILIHLAPLSGSKSTLTQDVFSESAKNTFDKIFERTWRILIKG